MTSDDEIVLTNELIMAISDKTRKLLWGRSGNRCAICQNQLIADATKSDDESVVADECHIISPKPNGPRHDLQFPAEGFDSYDNLILLCRTHHKMIDDQTTRYTPEKLRQIKAQHEQRVSEKLSEQGSPKPVRIRRCTENIPRYLTRLTTGKELLDLVTNAMGYSFDHDPLSSQKEVDLVSSFLQEVQDCGECSTEMEAGARVQTAYHLTEFIHELEGNGFFVFGVREVQILEGGTPPEPSDWPIAIVQVLRKDNEAIIHTSNL